MKQLTEMNRLRTAIRAWYPAPQHTSQIKTPGGEVTAHPPISC